MDIKKSVFHLFLFVLFFFPVIAQSAIIEEYCFIDNFGIRYRFIGGRLGKKAFATKVIHPACGTLSGVTTLAKRNDGTYAMTAIIGRNTASTCSAFEISASFDGFMFGGSGNYDNLPRNSTPDGSITFSAINCATVAVSHTDTVRTPPQVGPGKPTQ